MTDPRLFNSDAQTIPLTKVAVYLSSFALVGDLITNSCDFVRSCAVADIEASRNKVSSSIMRRQLSTNFLCILNMFRVSV